MMSWILATSCNEEYVLLTYISAIVYTLTFNINLGIVFLTMVLFLATVILKFAWDWDEISLHIVLGKSVSECYRQHTWFYTGFLLFALSLYMIKLILWRWHYEFRIRKCYIYNSRTSKSSVAATELLSMLMPRFVIDRITSFTTYGLTIADDAGYCTILFCDIYEFDKFCKGAKKDVVVILDELYRKFDSLCLKYGVQKIETVGKTYMCCGGLKSVEERLPYHLKSINYSSRVIELAREMMKFAEGYKIQLEGKIQLKIGIHYGECMMGVIGYHKPQFSLIGDTVNFTSRHCTTGLPGHIMVSEDAWIEGDRWDLDYEIVTTDMKGKGWYDVYHVYPLSRDLKTCILEAIQNYDFIDKNEELVDDVLGEEGRKGLDCNEILA